MREMKAEFSAVVQQPLAAVTTDEQIWQAIIDAEQAVNIVTDEEGHMLWVNIATTEVKTDSWLGKSMINCGEPLERMLFRRHFELCKAGKACTDFKFTRVNETHELQFAVKLSRHMPMAKRNTYLWQVQGSYANNHTVDNCQVEQDYYFAVANRMQENLVTEFMSALADELNQPLMSIVTYIGGCLEKIAHEVSCDDMPAVLQRIMKQAELMGERIHQLKHIVKHYDANDDNISVNEVIRASTSFLKASFTEANIRLELALSDGLPDVFFDKVQLQQILIYVLSNAREELLECTSGERIVHIHSKRTETGEIHITIWDNGRGIDPESLQKIFDPFYTTKKQALGMGLSMTRSVIESQGGKILVNSGDKTGTEFTIILPIANGTKAYEYELCDNEVVIDSN